MDEQSRNNSLKQAFRRVWLDNGHGHEAEWEYHWNYANNLRNNTYGKRWMYHMTVYPKIMRQAKLRRILDYFKR